MDERIPLGRVREKSCFTAECGWNLVSGKYQFFVIPTQIVYEAEYDVLFDRNLGENGLYVYHLIYGSLREISRRPVETVEAQGTLEERAEKTKILPFRKAA